MCKNNPVFLIALLTMLTLFSVPAMAAKNTPITDPPPSVNQEREGKLKIVRVYFEDEATARKLAKWIEPIEANYKSGYLVVEVTPQELALLEKEGFKVEIDTAQMIRFYQHNIGLAPGIESIPGYSCYRTVEETFTSAQDIVSTYPNLATWTDVGNSWEKTQGLGGYDMMVLKLTNANVSGPKPKIFFTSAIHAREYTTAELMTRYAEYLVSNYGIDADATWLLDYHEIHLMLQTNPDGRKKAEAGSLWRKNTNQNYCSPTSSSRGADLNRNFDFEWGCCGGSSGNQCSTTYRGPSPASEPEVQAVQNYLQSIFPDQRGPDLNDPAPDDTSGIYVDIHSSGRLLLWPWGFTSNVAPNGVAMQTMGRKLAYFNGHTPEQAIGLYATDGTTDDYAYGELGLASFTYELGTEFFQSCSYFENTLIPDNMPSLIYAAKVARTPYLTPSGPDSNSVALSAGSGQPGVPAGTQVTLTTQINDTRYNNSNGTESTQNIATAKYYLDTPPWEAGATAVALSPSDGNFNSKVENAQGTINTTGLSEGQHIVFVRGQDVNNNWGAVSAVFLYISNGAVTPTPTPTTGPTATPTTTAVPGTCTTYTSSDIPKSLPNGTSSVSSNLTVSGSGTIADVNVSVNMDHVWVGDLGFTLSKGGANVKIIDRPGVPASTYGCSGDNIVATLDDAAGTAVEGQCASSTPTINGTFSPNNALSAFNGLDGNGTWTLTVQDDYPSADSGTLNSWRVEICTSGGTTPTPTPLPPTNTPTPAPTNTPVPTNTPGPTSTPQPTNTPTPNPTATNTPGPGGEVFNDNFETNQGWVVNPSGSDTATTGDWERANPEETTYSGVSYQLGTTASGNFALITGPLAGSSVGSYDIDNGVTSVRSPNIVLPSNGTITLSFSYYLAHLNNATSADYLRVTVVGSSSSIVLEELGSADNDGGAWATSTTNLNSFAGQTIYLLIEAADASGGSLVEAAIDDVVITVN